MIDPRGLVDLPIVKSSAIPDPWPHDQPSTRATISIPCRTNEAAMNVSREPWTLS